MREIERRASRGDAMLEVLKDLRKGGDEKI